ncbi:MAG: type II toxin-antitoxin system Phd/YefM family antitoxin [Desulfobacterales bacterium]|nr:type II toxin-antitoxin system Phd/YefM family antitoxin [Desulfobacterales bacterium]
MHNTVSKSKFKPKALQFFRDVETTKKALIITDRGKSVLKIIPYSEDVNETMKSLRNSVIKFEDPFAPVGLDDWETLK